LIWNFDFDLCFFMNNDNKIITQHWGKIDPLKIKDYINVGGYEVLKKIIRDLKLEDVIIEINKSGLCGRGGAGFPMGKKLEQVAAKKGEKYFICNLDESEPGTYKDRAIVDNNPHILIEGLIILSLAIGAKKASIYINGNYKKQKEILESALSQSRDKEFWGRGIIGSPYDLEIELVSGAGAYICGEETALINSIEGNRGEPKMRPPYPTDHGLFGCPTVINNAETISNVPWIILNGGKKYASIGSAESPGVKLYILNGAIKNSGVFEGSTGITIRQIIEEFGGGMKRGKKFWFAQIGGASGRLATEKELDTPLTYNRSSSIPIGSGSILVVDKTADIKDILLSWTTFFRSESCGKCVPCREGTFRLWEIAKRLQDGKIAERDEKAIEDILWTLENTTFCPLGKFAATAFRDVVEKLEF
jgi:NADH:ubiquinone oxidoreductase subunit F (NADH-binding)